MKKPGLLILFGVGFTIAALSARAPHQAQVPLGFSAASGKPQLDAEEKLKQAISAQSISELHRMVTARPHVAGTPGGKTVADAIAHKLREFGLRVEDDAHSVHLSYPKRIRLALLRPVREEIPVHEPALAPDDLAGRNQELTPGFVAYSATGKVTGPVVYVNYGLPGDYEALKAVGVEVQGAVVVARYGRVHRAVKVFNAEQRGARGMVIYSDPADDGFAQGDPWPAGPWRHPQFLQRGNAKYSWYYHGDPLTPGYACGPDCITRLPSSVETLPKIPVAAISWSAAQPILRALGGSVVPRGFQGALPFAYHTGPGAAELELDVEMENGPRPIYNVVGKIPGSLEADRWVILGTHHDAWTYGGVDPGSACAALLELARVLGEMRKGGWQPKRTIVLAFWDAEEYGLIGSTEFAERYAKELREKAVVYINSDLYMAGGLRAGGTASLRDFVAGVARDVASPAGGGSVYAKWRQEAWNKLSPAEKRSHAQSFEVELDPLGSGADFVSFQTHLGLPALALEFGGESYGSYGAYHSNYDTRWFMETFGDPGWRYGPALAEVLGRAAMRLASADILPDRYSHLGEALMGYAARLDASNVNARGEARIEALRLETVRAKVREFLLATRALEQSVDAALLCGNPSIEVLRKVNTHLAAVERSFVIEDPPREKTGKAPRWYRHTVYGWNIYALYSGQTLPALNRALETGDAVAFMEEKARLEHALAAATAELQSAHAALRSFTPRR